MNTTPRPSSYPLLGTKYPLFWTIYPQLRVQGGSWFDVWILNLTIRTSDSGHSGREVEAGLWLAYNDKLKFCVDTTRIRLVKPCGEADLTLAEGGASH